MSLPGLVAEWVTQRASPAEVYAAVPVLIRGSFPLFADILESEKLTSGMVEDTVHHNADSVFMAEAHKTGKIFVGTKSAVHETEIFCIVAVGAGLKERSDVDRGAI